ncbi:MAG: septum formation protein Maf [Clostridia bacterium]|nr:septum formation protein Maf [Clostridia bacterium]
METKKQWILASASPRRRELLAKLLDNFEILPSEGEENTVETHPEEIVKALARQKAEEVFSRPVAKGKIVLGADTVVALDGKILGKPKDEEEAFKMLSALSGRTHEVYTGVCILFSANGETQTILEADCTKVTFYDLDKEFIDGYIASGSPMDKAGAYGIQDGNLARCIDGSFSNVVGLPVELCRRMILEMKKRIGQVRDEQ